MASTPMLPIPCSLQQHCLDVIPVHKHGAIFTIEEGGDERKIPSKYSGRIKGGGHLRIKTPGGGGFGPMRERDIESLKRDFVDEKISAAKIEADYGAEVMRSVTATR
jgi:N-methylhydantoinase B/oxoprolinase/acetone carboxylase alpha subunit